MELGDDRRLTLQRAVREPGWQPDVGSPEGAVLKELAAMGWVELEIVGYQYQMTMTDRGLERHRAWGDERRVASRRKAA